MFRSYPMEEKEDGTEILLPVEAADFVDALCYMLTKMGRSRERDFSGKRRMLLRLSGSAAQRLPVSFKLQCCWNQGLKRAVFYRKDINQRFAFPEEWNELLIKEEINVYGKTNGENV